MAIAKADDGHLVLDDARWHTPTIGDPTHCAVKGCNRVLTRHLQTDDIDVDDNTDFTSITELDEEAS